MPRKVHDGVRKRCECSRRQWSKCSHPWHFSFHHASREYRYSLDKVARARHEQPPLTKSEAAGWRDRLRGEIRAGQFVDPDTPPPMPQPADTRLTFGDVCKEYLKRHVQIPTRRPRGRREMEILIAMLRRAEIPAANDTTTLLETKPLDGITRAEVEAVRAWRRQEQAAHKIKAGTKGGEVGTNRLLSRLRHVFSWAIAEGFLTETPFKRGPVSVVRMETSVEGARTRRLEPSVTLPDGTMQEGEEARLLKHAGPHLRALIVAALSTGCRLGELLSLQWSQVRRDEQGQARWIVLPASKTKTAEASSNSGWAESQIGPRVATPCTRRKGTWSNRLRFWGRMRGTGEVDSDRMGADLSPGEYLRPAFPRSATRVCQSAPRVACRLARRPNVPWPRGYHHHQPISSEHASAARTRPCSARGIFGSRSRCSTPRGNERKPGSYEPKRAGKVATAPWRGGVQALTVGENTLADLKR